MEGFLRYQFGGLIFGILRYKNDFQQKHGTRHNYSNLEIVCNKLSSMK